MTKTQINLEGKDSIAKYLIRLRALIRILICQKSWSAVLFLSFLIGPFFVICQETNPTEVSVTLRINKVYDINSVNETYKIDGYLLYEWNSEKAKYFITDSLATHQIFENEKARELMKSELWLPAFELINVQGNRETPNIRIEIYSSGKIEYEERFFDTFSTDMNFRKFPFDSKNFKIEIEPFSYDSLHLKFTNPKLYINHATSLGEDWVVNKDSCTAKIGTHEYKYLDADLSSPKNHYARATFKVQAKREYGYYLWQVLFPLLIIILSSFTIFWIKDFGTQIGVGFTLMLTVVAFNFYSASILPKLPYNTFIENVIIIGYMFIFLGIVAVIINHRINKTNLKDEGNSFLFKRLRYIFPLAYLISMLVLVASTFWVS